MLTFIINFKRTATAIIVLITNQQSSRILSIKYLKKKDHKERVREWKCHKIVKCQVFYARKHEIFPSFFKSLKMLFWRHDALRNLSDMCVWEPLESECWLCNKTSKPLYLYKRVKKNSPTLVLVWTISLLT